jgi:hypothetical protein
MKGKKLNSWDRLQHLSMSYMKVLHEKNPTWSLGRVLEELELPNSKLFIGLALRAGFKESDSPTSEQVCAIAGLCMNGVWSKEIIAAELNLSLAKVEQVFKICAEGYGASPYGKSCYGGTRKRATGQDAVARRVTTAGQFSYRGCLYTLGASYRGRNAMIYEKGNQLLITFVDRAPIYVTYRNPKECAVR